MSDKSIVVLLTGTIDPLNVSFMKRDNTQERLQDYILALKKWLKNSDLKIVFVENSAFPKNEILNQLHNYSNTDFEYLSYYGQDFSRDKGKGFGEISSFEFAFLNSNFLKEADYIIKCNGRYYLKNIKKLGSLIATDNENIEVFGNFRRGLAFMDSRVFAFSPDFFFNYFLKYKDYINDSKMYYFEHALASATHELLSVTRGSWKHLPVPLLIDGISGTSNTPYNNRINRLKVIVKFYLEKLIT